MDAPVLLSQAQARVDACLGAAINDAELSPGLRQAMAYSGLGGKRVRAALVYGAGACLGVAAPLLDPAASAVEALHAYSLIHDDLPAMDDDALRRGRPTCHLAFDEATAILAGDALQALAFDLLSRPQQGLGADQQLAMVASLARAAGAAGMVGGQMLDMAAEGETLSIDQLQRLHAHKTGALIGASVDLGALACADLSQPQRQALAAYSRAVGLAFQVQDDILDITADTATLGKAQGADLARGKSTFPALLGLDASRARVQQLLDEALDALAPFAGAAQPLRLLAQFVVNRGH